MTEVRAPGRGDAIWLRFDAEAGHEQAGRRPALVVSPVAYNAKSGLALVCPITSRAKGYPFEVALPDSLPISGVVLADQVRSIDWRARRGQTVAKLPEETVHAVLAKLEALLR